MKSNDIFREAFVSSFSLSRIKKKNLKCFADVIIDLINVLIVLIINFRIFDPFF